MSLIKANNQTLSAVTSLPSAIDTGSLILLSTNNVTSATSEVEIDVSSSSYTNFQLIISNLLPATNSARFNARMKQGGSYVTSGAYSYVIGDNYVYASGVGTTSVETDTNNTKIEITSEMKNTTAETNSVNLMIYNPSGTTNYKSMSWHNQNYGSVLTDLHRNYMGSSIMRSATSAVTNVKFYMDSGNIARGLFKLYGIAD